MRRRTAFTALLESDDIVIRRRRPNPPYGRFAVCVACLSQKGRFELMTDAWEAMLGFAPGELDGRSLFTLLPCGRADERVLRRMIDRREPDPFLLRLRCKHGGAVELLLYRRFDEYDGSIFIAASPPDGAVMPTQDRASGDRTHP